ncbi:MAG: extracellular solute-binding protein, partial [Candidatus Omnitrophica bacterium]|nr:extracellular solute-binding protein [Candidatus Omnitrophota bacterium]
IAKWQSGVFGDLANKKATSDLIIGDSQWLGMCSRRGHYIDITGWVKERDIETTMFPATIKGYSEYPKGSDRYWAVPLEGDAIGWAYRKDLFIDPAEKKAFLERYGHELKVPVSWKEINEIAEFFTRPDKGIYGVGLITSEEYDTVTMGFENIFFSLGGDYGDEKYRVKGILNSEKSVKALEFFKELYKFTPPNWDNASYSDTVRAFEDGKVALVNNYFAHMVPLTKKDTNPFETGFFANPVGPYGDKYAALGGMGISIVAYSKKKDAALKFLDWFVKEETQKKWAGLGGFPCNKNVLTSAEFVNSSSFNKALSDSMAMLKDFWAVPEYDQLLSISQKELRAYLVSDDITAKDTLDQIADEWEKVFEYAGYYKE